MNNFEKSMAEVFDVTPTVVEENKKEILPVVKSEKENKEQELQQDLTDAYQQSKENLQDLIDNGKEAMEELLAIAKEGQHPRAYEVYGTLLKNMVDANKELLAVQKQMRDMDGKKKDGGDTRIDKAVFVGSTDELSKLPAKHEIFKNPDLQIERTDYVELDLPPLAKISNRADVIFFGAEPNINSHLYGAAVYLV